MASERAPKPFSDPAERFWKFVQPTGFCWLWGGSPGERYGRFNVRVGPNKWKSVLAHRWAYEHLVGPIPDGLTIDHLCRIPTCVNPDHMEPVTARVNYLRTFNPIGRGKSHCPKGHPYSGDNLHIDSRGAKTCRKCKAESSRRYVERKRNATV